MTLTLLLVYIRQSYLYPEGKLVAYSGHKYIAELIGGQPTILIDTFSCLYLSSGHFMHPFTSTKDTNKTEQCQ